MEKALNEVLALQPSSRTVGRSLHCLDLHLLLSKMMGLDEITSKHTSSDMTPGCHEVCGSGDNIGITALSDC